jgi:hypothetical protein
MPKWLIVKTYNCPSLGPFSFYNVSWPCMYVLVTCVYCYTCIPVCTQWDCRLFNTDEKGWPCFLERSIHPGT